VGNKFSHCISNYYIEKVMNLNVEITIEIPMVLHEEFDYYS